MWKRILGLVVALVVIGLAVWFYYQREWSVPRAAGEVAQQVRDTTTTGKVKSAFALSKRLSAYEIGVDTNNGVVTLTGAVPSTIDKELAESVAKDTTGVDQVDNQLQVQAGLQPSEASLRENTRVTDLEIRANLQEQLSAKEELEGRNIQVGVENRVVTLSGQVENETQKKSAEELARAVPNVATVVNLLSVGSGAESAARAQATPAAGASASEMAKQKDSELAKQVSFALFNERDNFSDVSRIKVDSREGKVKLTGSVNSRAERALAERIAGDVAGVSDVDNQLTISQMDSTQRRG